MTPDWVIGDTHIGHENIRAYCPWRQTWSDSLEEHDARLIIAWQSKIGPSDIVLHLGDVCLCPKEQIAIVRAYLPGQIILVVGNHDRTVTAMKSLGFVAYKHFEFDYLGRTAICRHDPSTFTEAEVERATWLLHGHWHGDDHRQSHLIKPNARSKLIDCGIDALRSLSPVRLSEVIGANQP